MRNIVIFGGTFDPVHEEHVMAVKAVLRELNADKVIIVPTFLPPHKNLLPTNGENRLDMLKLAFKNVEKIEISDCELKAEGKSYSYITVERFREEYKNDDLWFCVGGDMLNDFKTWKFPERILAAANLIALKRDGFSSDIYADAEFIEEKFGKSVKILNYAGKDVSSTEIRTYLALGLKPDGINEEVYGYIKEKGLYLPDKYQKYVAERLPIKRLTHTANVVSCAVKKAKEAGIDVEKARIAATLHDCAKYDDPKNYKEFSLPVDVPPPVVHAFLGAFVAEHVLGVKDEEILDAIKFHTSGKPNMTELGKLIFVADMVEKGRDYLGVDKLRKAFDGDLDACFLTALKEEVMHLLNKGQRIYGATLDAYEYYLKDENDR